MLQLLQPESVPETDNSEVDKDFLPDLRPGNENLENYLLSNDCPLLSNIVTQLKVFNHDKWDGKSKEYMCHSSRPFCTRHVPGFGLVGRMPGPFKMLSRRDGLLGRQARIRRAPLYACRWICLRMLAHA